MRDITFLFFTAMMVLITMLLGCAVTPVFHNTAESDLMELSNALTNTRLEDLFRSYPTLRLVKSTDIGNGNMRHEFSYATVEKEDESQRPSYSSYPKYLYEKRITYSINIFVDKAGVIYEVLQPVQTDVEILMTNEPYNRFKSKTTGNKTRSLPYP